MIIVRKNIQPMSSGSGHVRRQFRHIGQLRPETRHLADVPRTVDRPLLKNFSAYPIDRVLRIDRPAIQPYIRPISTLLNKPLSAIVARFAERL